MTVLKPDQPLSRETGVFAKGGRPLLIELYPQHLELREKGRRFRVRVDYRSILDLGYKILWRQRQAEQQAARKARRKGRSK